MSRTTRLAGASPTRRARPRVRSERRRRDQRVRVPASPSTFTHGGASGTRLWIDPERGLVFVFLTNAWGASDAADVRDAGRGLSGLGRRRVGDSSPERGRPQPRDLQPPGPVAGMLAFQIGVTGRPGNAAWRRADRGPARQLSDPIEHSDCRWEPVEGVSNAPRRADRRPSDQIRSECRRSKGRRPRNSRSETRHPGTRDPARATRRRRPAATERPGQRACPPTGVEADEIEAGSRPRR